MEQACQSNPPINPYLQCQMHLQSPKLRSVLSGVSSSVGFSKLALDQSCKQLEPVKRRFPKIYIYYSPFII